MQRDVENYIWYVFQQKIILINALSSTKNFNFNRISKTMGSAQSIKTVVNVSTPTVNKNNGNNEIQYLPRYYYINF